MSTQIFQRYIFFGALFLIVVWASFIQAHTYINVDVGWFLKAAERLMKGGSYTHDFFENNPPWIIYLSIPPVLLSKIVNIHLALSLRIYVFSIAFISLGLSYYFLNHTFVKSDLYLKRFLLVILAFLFLVLSSFEFGQREHLLFMMSMPYLLLIEQRLQGRHVHVYLAMFVGLWAGLAFILKPYFLMTLFLVELYYTLRTKKLGALIRPETLAILGLLCVYAIILSIYHKDYFSTVLPLALRYCYIGSRNPLPHLLLSQFCMVCYFSMIFFMLTYKMNRYKPLSNLFFLSLLGFFFSYAVQQEDVYYRLLPAYAMSLLLFVFMFASYVSSPIKSSRVYLWTFYFALILFIYLKRTTYLFDFYPFYYPFLSFFFVATVFLMVLFLVPFPNFYQSKYYITFTFVCCMMLLLPMFQFFTILDITRSSKKDSEKLINYINDHMSHQSYYFFATHIPNFIEQNANNVSRFSFFWYLPGLVKKSYVIKDKDSYDQYQMDKTYVGNMIAEDLMTKKPQWVLVDVSTKKSYLYWETADTLTHIPFNYKTYFSDNKKLMDIWKNYHYVTTTSSYHHNDLNPYQYKIHLSSATPDQNAILFRDLYLYINHQDHLEMAFRDADKMLRTMEVSLDPNHSRSIKHTLTMQGKDLSKSDKREFFNWVLKQSITYEVGKFDIYRSRYVN